LRDQASNDTEQISQMKYTQPWQPVSEELSSQLAEEVAKSVVSDPIFLREPYRVIAMREDRSQVLCEIRGFFSRFALVQILSSKGTSFDRGLLYTMINEEHWEEYLSFCANPGSQCHPVLDIELKIDAEIAGVLRQMPAQCQLECCGFGCIDWDQRVFDEYRVDGLEDRMLAWLHTSIDYVQSCPSVRYVNSVSYEIIGGNPEHTVKFFREAIQSLLTSRK
jgi:hypothetical protein